MPARRAVMGRVVDAHGDPVRHWRMDVEAYPSDNLTDLWVRADAAAPGFLGNLWLRLPDGEYDITLKVRCGETRRTIGWLATGGQLVAERAEAQPLVVDGGDLSGIVLRMDAAPSETFSECDFGPLHEVRGVVVGPDGRPLSGIQISAWDTTDWGGSGQDHAFSNASREFVLQLPRGEYGFAPRYLNHAGVSTVSDFVADHFDELHYISAWNQDFVSSTETIVVQGDNALDVRMQIVNAGACYEHLLLQALAKHH